MPLCDGHAGSAQFVLGPSELPVVVEQQRATAVRASVTGLDGLAVYSQQVAACAPEVEVQRFTGIYYEVRYGQQDLSRERSEELAGLLGQIRLEVRGSKS